jgi:uncharacterized SAM-binding protein YcdF (DUF218 family)
LIYFLSKAFWFLVQPGNLLFFIVLLVTVVAWLWRGRGLRGILTLITATLVFIMVFPIESWIAYPLEVRFKAPDKLPEKLDGIIVLGGISQSRIADATGSLGINQSAERLMVSAALALHHPEARFVITGRGENHPTVIAWLEAIGLPRTRIEFEPDARNTIENAFLTHKLIEPEPEEQWILVTSALHMPRAVGTFREVGWKVIPLPVDYRAADGALLDEWPDLAEKLYKIGIALKEWVGLSAYYLMGKSEALFPAAE